MPLDNSKEKPYLITNTDSLKLVSDYCGLNFAQVLNLDCCTYKILTRDAFIHKMRSTEQGQEYLEQCWILTQTAPDKSTLREQFGKAG